MGESAMIDWQDETTRPDFRSFVARLGPCAVLLYGFTDEQMHLECIYEKPRLQSDPDAAKAAAPQLIRDALQAALAALDEIEREEHNGA